MTTICFVGTYPPIICGIADYTSLITRVSFPGEWGILSFRLEDCEVPLAASVKASDEPVWYGIPSLHEYSAPVILDGITKLELRKEDTVLWFQHEFNIWQDSDAFVAMLKQLDLPRVVTLHTLRFQTNETPFGLSREEYSLLRDLLPNVDAITVFSRGVYVAVITAFPEHRKKVHILRHGVRSYAEMTHLSRRQAKEAFNDFLLGESDLEPEMKKALRSERIFLDPDTVILGQMGFLHPTKGSKFLHPARDGLQELLPQRRIVAIRIGMPRLPEHIPHAIELRKQQNGKDEFLFDIWLPEQMLPLAARAFDINYYWPNECTQSGMITHAFGVGALFAGRDLEGVGETLKTAGALYDSDPGRLLLKIRDLVLDPKLQEKVREKAVNYAKKYSWENQARRHYRLAGRLLSTLPERAN
jgi:glycosyltransferase involved in cell wall biosynthesis